MKKFGYTLFLVFLSCSLSAQTFVSTEQQNRVAVLEEFTGVECQFCPDGHRIANQLAQKYPGQFLAINVHTGTYADNKTPNYTTDFGAAIANVCRVKGYPTGTVNRQPLFTGRSKSTDRTQWEDKVKQVIAQPSPANIAAQSTIDWDTRTLSVKVETYFTSTPAESAYLNVALLMNNVKDTRQVGRSIYPERISLIAGVQYYSHYHMLRHLLTGQWGQKIQNTAAGSTFSDELTYIIPASLKEIPYDLSNLEVIVYLSDDNMEIITGAKSSMTHLNNTGKLSGDVHFSDCSVNVLENNVFESSVGITNMTETPITSITIQYSSDRNNYTTLTLDKNSAPIASMQTDTFNIPELTITGKEYDLKLTGVNGVALPESKKIEKRFNRLDFAGELAMGQLYEKTCDKSATPIIRFKNNGIDNIYSIKYLYGIEENAITNEGEITELISNRNTVLLDINSIDIPRPGSQKFYLKITSVNGVNVNVATLVATLKKQVYWAKEFIKLELNQDQWGSDITWKLTNKNGDIVKQGGPYENLGSVGTKLHTETYTLPSAADTGCYVFEIKDLAGDGVYPPSGSTNYGLGSLTLLGYDPESTNGVNVYPGSDPALNATSGNFNGGITIPIMLVTKDMAGISQASENIQHFSVYPNPLQGDKMTVQLSLKKATTGEIIISDMLGKEVKRIPSKTYGTDNQIFTVDMNHVPNGMYIVRFNSPEGNVNQKLIITK